MFVLCVGWGARDEKQQDSPIPPLSVGGEFPLPSEQHPVNSDFDDKSIRLDEEASSPVQNSVFVKEVLFKIGTAVLKVTH